MGFKIENKPRTSRTTHISKILYCSPYISKGKTKSILIIRFSLHLIFRKKNSPLHILLVIGTILKMLRYFLCMSPNLEHVLPSTDIPQIYDHT